jgi:SNF2 family DNA or RNA helicase
VFFLYITFFLMDLLIPFPGFLYHPHQSDAVRWMIAREAEDAIHFRGGILADEMGLGKTFTTIGLLLNNPLPETLILVPPVLIGQWNDALKQCHIPHRILAGRKPTGFGNWHLNAGTAPINVTLSTYDRAMYNKEIINDRPYDRIVCDEGHVLRNGQRTRRFRVTFEIGALRRWILSGTPVQNTIGDFLNLLKWLHMETPNIKCASDVVLRRTVADVRMVVVAMPESLPTHVIHRCVMPEDGEEQAVFNALVGRFEHAVETHARATIILELYLRIQQFLAHPTVYVESIKRKFKDTYKRSEWIHSATKMEEFTKWLYSEPSQPTIIFTTFRTHMDIVETIMKKQGYNTYRICGGMSESARKNAIDSSKSDVSEGKSVAILVQIVSGSAGLNLQHCNRVVFLTNHWNPAVVDQAVARAYRLGQTKPVTVHYFLLADNAEKNIDRIMIGKHGIKRDCALTVHPKLFCEAAAGNDLIIHLLDDVISKTDIDEDPTEE